MKSPDAFVSVKVGALLLFTLGFVHGESGWPSGTAQGDSGVSW